MTATNNMNEAERALASGEVSLENVRFARMLQDKALSRKVSPYQQNLRDRLRHRSEAHRPKLHEGKYRTYDLIGGTHTRVEPHQQAAADQENAALREAAEKRGQKQFAEVKAEETTYHFKERPRITPLTDAEALMMDQNPTKFRWVGAVEPANQTHQVDELLAEVERMKSEKVSLQAELAEAKKAGKK